MNPTVCQACLSICHTGLEPACPVGRPASRIKARELTQ